MISIKPSYVPARLGFRARVVVREDGRYVRQETLGTVFVYRRHAIQAAWAMAQQIIAEKSNAKIRIVGRRVTDGDFEE